MIYGQMPIGEMPINLVLLPETQEVVFVIVRPFNTVYDMSTDSMDAYFDMESFNIGGNSYFYNSPYDYKELLDMLKWLQQQKLLLNELTIYKGI